MNRYLSTPLLGVCAVSAISITMALPARADVFGRLRVTVKNADTEKPVENVKVTLHDTANVRADTPLNLNATGNALSEPLENRAFEMTVVAEGFQTDTRTVNVAADTTTTVEVLLEPVEKTIQISGARSLLRPRTPTVETQRTQSFIARSPALANNPQQLQGLLATVPGIALDSNNQAHARGEHTQTSIYIGGFQLGGALVGRFGPLIVPEALQSVDVQTGAFSPEYGSETAAILNTTVRSGTIKRTFELNPGFGGFGTQQGSFSLGGQAGEPVNGLPVEGTGGSVEKRFRYFINGTTRRTDNALDPPQPDDQTAHNDGNAQSLLGRFDYVASPRDSFTLTLNGAPARTQVTNRTGLPDRFAGVGQGYGFAGALSRADALASGDPLLAVTQQQAGQDINQRDNNDFGVLQYRHGFSDRLTGLVSLGGARSKLDVTNNNPAVYQNLATLGSRPDAAVEFSPTVSRNGQHAQLEGSLNYVKGDHNFKVGLSTDQQRGNESYSLIPASQLALNALFGAAPELVPAGTARVDANGDPVLDANDNPVYDLAPGATTPTVGINRRGYYRAAYAQDTWNVTRKLTANYGIRLDMFNRSETVNGTTTNLNRVQGSPRANLSYALNRGLVARASYNRLFIQPPLSEGGTIGSQIQPETLNQYEVSLEKQLQSNQSLKLGYYYKQIKNQLDIALLVPGSQIGIYSAVNLANDGVHGLEASYQLQPRRGYGPSAYLSYAYAVAKFNDPNEGADFNDHDQRHTLSAGANYSLKSGASAGLNVLYGSGTASSVVNGDGAFGFSGQRTPRTRVDLRLQSSPHLFGGKGGLRLDVDNLLDNRSLINFGSDFSGTRFQQGRRVVLSAFTSF